jgi:hypothetical protein
LIVGRHRFIWYSQDARIRGTHVYNWELYT